QKNRIDAVGSEKRPRVTGAAVRLETQQMDDKRVARLRTFDVERPGLRIGALSALCARCVLASRVDRVGVHPIAGFDPQRRRMRAGEGVIKDFGFKPMSLRPGRKRDGEDKKRQPPESLAAQHKEPPLMGLYGALRTRAAFFD